MKSTEHYALALESLGRANALAAEHTDDWTNGVLPTGVAATVALHLKAADVHAKLADVALEYEDYAKWRESWVYVHPDGREFPSAAAAEAAGARYEDYQHEDGTVEDDALVLDGKVLADRERTVPANAPAEALVLNSQEVPA